MSYTKSCRNGLWFDVGLYNSKGGLIKNVSIIIGNYPAGVGANIDKGVIADPLMSESNQVSRLVVSNVRCR